MPEGYFRGFWYELCLSFTDLASLERGRVALLTHPALSAEGEIYQLQLAGGRRIFCKLDAVEAELCLYVPETQVGAEQAKLQDLFIQIAHHVFAAEPFLGARWGQEAGACGENGLAIRDGALKPKAPSF